MNRQDTRQLLKERIAEYNRDPDDEQLPMLLELVKKVDPKGYSNLMMCQCAYEFHMILESIIDP